MNHNLNLSQHETFETKLALLQEVLDKKRAALTIVLNISENQETLYLSPPSDERREFLMEMGKEKQAQIDEVLICDEVFQRIFDSIADEFKENSETYAEKIRQLQFSINEVLELDVKIRAQEEKGKAAANKSFSRQSAQANINPANTSYILEQYRAASKNKPQTGGN